MTEEMTPERLARRVVVCASNRNQDGKIVCGARHWDAVMRGQILVDGKRPEDWLNAEQGFIDQWGNFLTREEAWQIAKAQGQIKYPKDFCHGVLFSEDLY